MKIRVDMSKCQAYGNCFEEAPEHFALDEWGYVELLNDGVIPPGAEERARRGVAACPSDALTLEE